MPKQTLIIANPICKHHLTGVGHPESPARFDAICSALTAHNLLRSDNWHSGRSADTEEIALCHTSEYIQLVRRETLASPALTMLSTGDAPICPASYDVALLAVGSALTGVDSVLKGEADNAFAIVRPSGHHACSDRGMGFCLFNNVAIAARYAQQQGNLQRVLIVDWDLHHGNGTQEIFNSDPSVFYFSTHQSGIYPGTGAATDCGVGAAAGTKMNLPILATPDARFQILSAFEGTLQEAMHSFKPEFILISCGFDAHFADPLGQLNLTDSDYGQLTRIILKIAAQHCQGRVVSVLEGGYNLRAIGSAAVTHVSELQGGE